jgi:hypothetical protein
VLASAVDLKWHCGAAGEYPDLRMIERPTGPDILIFESMALWKLARPCRWQRLPPWTEHEPSIE